MNIPEDFDPSAASDENSGIFGLPFGEAESALVLLPVPWEATVSYGGGAAGGPAAVLAASRQVDLFDIDVDRPYAAGLHLLPESSEVRTWNAAARADAELVIKAGGDLKGSPELEAALARVNAAGARLNSWVEEQTTRLLEAGKTVGVLGGDHSVPLGALRAFGRAAGPFGILHIDAHSDTRDAYEGFTWSHASIMRNALDSVPQAETIVQVGIRDFCEQEADYCRSQGKRMRTFYDRDLSRRQFAGETWGALSGEIAARLPEKVWVSFDIDGLDPRFCPNTGTPVPGGLDFNQANHLLAEVVGSGKKILGFDLCEVSPPSSGAAEWDANVGARLLYKLSGWSLASQGIIKIRK